MEGKRLKAARDMQNLTQEELAKRAGMSQRTIGRYETSNGEADEAILIRLASVLEVSTDYLLGLSEDPKSTSKLSEYERVILLALRRGDKLGAVKAIVGG